MIFAMRLEVLRQVVDARRHQRDLNFGRPGVALMLLMLGYDRLFLSFSYTHLFFL
jgi:hypothetical protein